MFTQRNLSALLKLVPSKFQNLNKHPSRACHQKEKTYILKKKKPALLKLEQTALRRGSNSVPSSSGTHPCQLGHGPSDGLLTVHWITSRIRVKYLAFLMLGHAEFTRLAAGESSGAPSPGPDKRPTPSRRSSRRSPGPRRARRPARPSLRPGAAVADFRMQGAPRVALGQKVPELLL